MSETGLQDRGAQGRLDFLIGLIAVVGAIVAALWIIPAQIEPTSAAGQLSPRFFPTLSVSVIALFGLALMFKNRGFALSRLPHPGPALLLETLAWAAWATADHASPDHSSSATKSTTRQTIPAGVGSKRRTASALSSSFARISRSW